jgi:hypothetical protein
VGYTRAVKFTVDSKFGNVQAVFSYDNVECSGQEEFLDECSHVNSEDCNEDEGAGVVCE